MDIGFALPTLASLTHLDELAKGLTARKADVFMLDPLYLSLLGNMDGQPDAMGNVFEVGPLLLRIARACLDNGCTPIIAAHARKHLKASWEPIYLDDLAWAGIAECARQ